MVCQPLSCSSQYALDFDDLGVNVYKALAEIVVELLREPPDRTLFIPSVILLPTVPWFRKVNKIDMGVADKLASTVMAVHQYSLRESLERLQQLP